MKTTFKLFAALLALAVAAFGQHITAYALAGPVFDYPVDGQTLDFEGSYLFRVQPIPSAQGYLWGFFQNGVMVWENWRDEGTLSSNEYGIHPDTVAHSKFALGAVEVWVRTWMNSQWSDATVVTIYLQPRATSTEVTIDVNPGRFPNRIVLEKNVCKDHDNLYVAIITTPTLDAQSVNASTLKLGDPLLNGTASPLRSRVRDVDHDGDKDMVLAFRLCKLVRNKALNKSTTELVLTGRTLDGVDITGRDSVKVVRVDEKDD